MEVEARPVRNLLFELSFLVNKVHYGTTCSTSFLGSKLRIHYSAFAYCGPGCGSLNKVLFWLPLVWLVRLLLCCILDGDFIQSVTRDVGLCTPKLVRATVVDKLSVQPFPASGKEHMNVEAANLEALQKKQDPPIPFDLILVEKAHLLRAVLSKCNEIILECTAGNCGKLFIEKIGRDFL